MPASCLRRARTATRTLAREQWQARRHVIRCFQEFVDSGSANWEFNAEGQRQLHLKRGAVFLLLDTAIKRLR